MFRIPQHLPKTLLGLLLAGSLTGCMAGGDGPSVDGATQRITGTIPQEHYAAKVVGVRVIAGGQQISASATDADGKFDIQVPVGQNYSFEIVTRAGAFPVLAGPLNGTTPMLFDVCDPGDDFDLGDIDPLDFEEIDGDDMPWSDTESDCEVPPWICADGSEDCFDAPMPCQDPMSDPAFCWDEPLPCDAPDANPEFCWDDGDDDWEGGEVPGCEDPNGEPNGCVPPPPGPCDDPAADPVAHASPPPWPSCPAEIPMAASLLLRHGPAMIRPPIPMAASLLLRHGPAMIRPLVWKIALPPASPATRSATVHRIRKTAIARAAMMIPRVGPSQTFASWAPTAT